MQLINVSAMFYTCIAFGSVCNTHVLAFLGINFISFDINLKVHKKSKTTII